MKTIFISVFQSFVARSILNTDAFQKLAANPDLRIVIFAPDLKKEFYNERFGGFNVIVAGIDNSKLSGFSGTISHKISIALLPTYFVKYREKIKFINKQYFGFALSATITYAFAPFKLWRRIFRWIDPLFIPTDLFDAFFEKYKPDLLFSTDIFNPADAAFLLSANRHTVRTIGMVRSWDCTTNKNLLRIQPEKAITNNETVKSELVKYHDVPAEKIKAIGFPQFDPYITEKKDSREDFFKKIGVPIDKKLILFAPAGGALSDIDWQYCEIFRKALEERKIPDNLHFLVRTHPQDKTDLSKFEKHPNFTIDKPGISFGGSAKATEFDDSAVRHLINSIYHSELVITVNTSLVLDSVIFDKPQIMLGFDGYEKRPFLRSVRRFQKEDNMFSFINTGAARMAERPEEAIDWIKKYLENPKSDAEGRAKARKEILMNPDGKSGERIANFILSFIDKI